MENLPEAVTNLLNLRGQIVSLTTVRAMDVRDGRAPITKEMSFRCRIGVTYDNIRKVQDKREEGILPAKNAGLKWGEWAVFPYIIHHNGQFYLRCTVLQGSRVESTFFQNGREISRDEAQPQCTSREFRENPHGLDVFTVKVESIVRVNHELVAA